MNFLPFEIYSKIFQDLDLPDLLKLREVSKKFKNVVKEFQISELIFNQTKQYRNSWWFTNRQMNYRYIILNEKTDFLNYDYVNLKNLKRLEFDSRIIIKTEISLKDVNKFEQLEHLKISFAILKNDDERILRLPNLKILEITYPNRQFIVEIDAPNLAALYLFCCYGGLFDSVKFKQPQSIRSLSSNYDEKSFSVFENLESVRFVCGSKINYELFKRLKNLKRVIMQLRTFDDMYHVDKVRNKQAFKNVNLKIYYEGIQMVKDKTYCEEILDPKNWLFFCMKNFDLLIDDGSFAPWYDELRYDELFRLTDKLPNNFFEKFVFHLYAIKISSKIENEDDLIMFIKKAKNLCHLVLSDSRLSQSFYDRLKNITALYHLTIYEDKPLKLDFKSIFSNLEYLNKLTTNQHVNLDQDFNFQRLKYFEKFYFKIGEKNVEMAKISKNEFSFRSPLFSKVFADYADLVDFLKKQIIL